MSTRSLVLVGPAFNAGWPCAAAHAVARLGVEGPSELLLLPAGSAWEGAGLVPDELARAVERLLLCNVGISLGDRRRFPALSSLGSLDGPSQQDAALSQAGLPVRRPRHEGYWGQSVAEFALGLTISALRRIPQTHGSIRQSLSDWDYRPSHEHPLRGSQFGDDPRFVNGTISGKRIGVIGLGNIGSRYAAWCSAMGAEVIGWDPVAPEPAFHRSGTRRVFALQELVEEVDILAPMMPLHDATASLVGATHINSLRAGALVVLVTRAGIVDMAALRQRVLAGELALAADVFDVEPLPLDDPLLRLGHVVHTPHNAGRTMHANRSLVDDVLDQMRVARYRATDAAARCADPPALQAADLNRPGLAVRQEGAGACP